MLKQRAQTTKPKLENHKELPLHTCKLPLNQCNPPRWMHARHHLKQGNCNSSALTGQTGQHHRSNRCATCEQDQHSDRSDRWPQPVRPVHTKAQKWLETTWKPSKCIQQAISISNFYPLVDNAWIKLQVQNFQPRASQIDKIQHRMLHMSKWSS
jgi:hypothetical protein